LRQSKKKMKFKGEWRTREGGDAGGRTGVRQGGVLSHKKRENVGTGGARGTEKKKSTD